MSKDIHIVGIMDPSEKDKQMKAVWDACMLAKINIPQEVIFYFADRDPNILNQVDIPFNFKHAEGQAIYSIYKDEIPEEIERIDFIISW